MKVLAYVAESNDLDKVSEKWEVLTLWVEVEEEMELVGVISELNDQRCLGVYGKEAISDVLEQYEIDAVVVVSADDFSKDKKEVCDCIGVITRMGAQVISINDDLPNCAKCENGQPQRANHCTVTIYHT